jgi:hypothetical protein
MAEGHALGAGSGVGAMAGPAFQEGQSASLADVEALANTPPELLAQFLASRPEDAAFVVQRLRQRAANGQAPALTLQELNSMFVGAAQ